MTDWRTAAACRGTDLEMWFPISEDGTSPSDADAITRAKAVCSRCPSQPECLEWALVNRCNYGVFGGLTSPERARVIKRGGSDEPLPPSDQVLIDRARLGYPVRVEYADRRRIVAALPAMSEVRLGRVFGVSEKTIYNDRQVLAGETPEAWSWRQKQGADEAVKTG